MVAALSRNKSEKIPMKRPTKFAFAVAILAGMTAAAHAQINYVGGTYTQDFDTLANTGTSSTVPSGWAFSEAGTGGNTTCTAGTGSGTTGDTYSFGATSAADRAFGGLQSGTVVPTIGASFLNNTGNTVFELAISYVGEQWRLGATSRVDQLDFQYSLDATSLTSGTWLDVNSLDFTAPTTTGSTGALDGNLAGNRTAISNSITGLSLANGSTIWIRWNDFNATGSDDGLGIDNFSLAVPVPEPSVYMLLGVGLLFCGQRFLRSRRA